MAEISLTIPYHIFVEYQSSHKLLCSNLKNWKKTTFFSVVVNDPNQEQTFTGPPPTPTPTRFLLK